MDQIRFIKSFWRDVAAQDANALAQAFMPDACIRWHCSNESFTVTEYVQANCEYPGDWDGEVERIHTLGDLVITATKVWLKDYSASFHVISFFQMQSDKIIALDEYWGDDGAAPLWRIEMGIGRPIK